MYIIDPDGKLIYKARSTASRRLIRPTQDATNYVKAALTEAMAGKPVANATTKAYGCCVKYAR